MKQDKKPKTTITLEFDTWQELQMIRIKGGYKTINEVIRVLLGER